MSHKVYIVGQKPRFEAKFRLGSVLTDPTTVRFIYKRPSDATITTVVYGVDSAVIRAGAGEYHLDLSLDQDGVWQWRWEGEGLVESADQGEFEVLPEAPV